MKYPLVYTQNASSQWIAVEKMLKSRFKFASILWFTLILWNAPSSAQQAEYLWSIENSLWVGPAVGEDYILEISGGLWNPHGNIAISSQQFGIAGSNIDFRQDLGLKKDKYTLKSVFGSNPASVTSFECQPYRFSTSSNRLLSAH